MILDENQLLILKPCRIERNLPELKWTDIWFRVRMPSLTSEVASFGWKMIHELLPTESRMSTTVRNTAPSCKFKCPGIPEADLQHCLLSCSLVKDVGSWLLSILHTFYNEEFSEVNILFLNRDLCEGGIWVILNTLHFCWSKRSLGKRATIEDCISSLKADLSILDESGCRNVVEVACRLINLAPLD